MTALRCPWHAGLGGFRWRTVLAFFLAPPLGGAIFGTALVLTLSWPHFELVIPGVIVGAVAGAVLGIPLIGTFGLLFHWAALKRGWTRWWHYLLGGATGGLFGFACIAIYDLTFPGSTQLPAHWASLFGLVTGGMIVSGLVWLIRRPDRG